MTLLSKATWAMQKTKIKDVYPKKVDHMLNEYVKKKRKKEKMHTQRRYATCLQRHVKKNVDSSRLKITKGERVRQKEFIHESPKIVHTLAHLDQVV